MFRKCIVTRSSSEKPERGFFCWEKIARSGACLLVAEIKFILSNYSVQVPKFDLLYHLMKRCIIITSDNIT